MFNINEMFAGACGKIKQDQFRMSLDGTLAVKTTKGYKAFDIKKNKMTKVGEFAIPGMQDMFFMFPTRKLQKGDIVLIDDTPVCVLEQNGEEIKVLSYENSTVETRMIENIVFFGKPIYGKVVSLFSMMFKRAEGSDTGMMKMIMTMQFFGGQNGNPLAAMFGGGQPAGDNSKGQPAANPFQQMLPMLMMSKLFGGGKSEGGFLDGMFDGILGEEASGEDE